MIISNTYIDDFTFNTIDYNIDTQLDIDWIELSDGNYDPIVRSANNDVYNAVIRTAGTESYINNILTQLDSLLIYESEIVTLSNIASDEHIFGEDLDYSNISGIVIDWGVTEQSSWHGFGLEIKMRALSPSFSSVAALPNFSGWNSKANYKGGTIPNVNIYDTYNGIYTYNFNKVRQGVAEVEINLTNEELGSLRRYVATNRGTTIAVSGINSLTYPFGPGLYNSLAPDVYNIKIMELKELSRFNIDRWITKLKLINVTPKI